MEKFETLRQFLEAEASQFHGLTQLDGEVVRVDFRGHGPGNSKEFFSAKLCAEQSVREWFLLIAKAMGEVEEFESGEWISRLE